MWLSFGKEMFIGAKLNVSNPILERNRHTALFFWILLIQIPDERKNAFHTGEKPPCFFPVHFTISGYLTSVLKGVFAIPKIIASLTLVMKWTRNQYNICVAIDISYDGVLKDVPFFRQRSAVLHRNPCLQRKRKKKNYTVYVECALPNFETDENNVWHFDSPHHYHS